MPTAENPTRSVESFSRHAQELESLANRWFAAYAEDQKVPDDFLNLFVQYIRNVANEFGFLAMAIGILDRETDLFAHYTRFPVPGKSAPTKNGCSILPYPTLHSSGFSLRLCNIISEDGAFADIPESDRIGEWLFDLFEIRRQHQLASKSPEFQKNNSDSTDARLSSTSHSSPPEGTIASPPEIFVSADEIRRALGKWVVRLLVVGLLINRKRYSVEELINTSLSDIAKELGPSFRLPEELRDFQTSNPGQLLACIDNLANCQEFVRLFPDSDKAIFFSTHPDYNASNSEHSRGILRHFFAALQVDEIYRALDIPQVEDWSDLGDQSRPLPYLLQDRNLLKFPVVEYLIVNLLYSRDDLHLNHIVWPFCKTLTHYPTESLGQHRSRCTFPALLLLTYGSKAPTDRTEAITHLYPFFLLMRVALEPFTDVLYYGGIVRPRALAIGRQEEKNSYFLALSHELKGLIRLIPDAFGKKFLLEALAELFRTIFVPAVGEFSENGSGRSLSLAVQGRMIDVETGKKRLCCHYQEWIVELLSLACRCHALASSWARAEQPDSKEELLGWQNQLALPFIISEELAQFKCPESFSDRCMLSSATICVLRNVLKHTYKTPEVDRNVSPRRVYWTPPVAGEYRIGVTKTPEATLLVISNPCSSDLRNPGKEYGTEDAANFFLNKIQSLGSSKGLGCNNRFDVDGCRYICTLPLL